MIGAILLGLSVPHFCAQAQTDPGGPTVILGGPAAGAQAPMKVSAAPSPSRDMNALILDAVRAMPTGGSYRANVASLTSLRRAIQATNSRLVIDPAQATPNFCSGATYLAFLSVLIQLNRDGRLPLDENVLTALLVQEHQADGAGIWGRWNANGPGTARLFHEADLGRNFTSFEEARPGDFMKVWWNDEIGARESGHSVVYLGRTTRADGEYVEYWSSNMPNGFGYNTVPRERIHRQLFTRFEHPENVARLASLPARDKYLGDMLKRPSSPDEMLRMVGAQDAGRPAVPAPAPLPVASPVPVADKPGSASKKTATPAPAVTPAASPAPKKGWWPFGRS